MADQSYTTRLYFVRLQEETAMQNLWGSTITREELKQSIKRLRELDQLPEIPRDNLVNLRDDPTRRLSLLREQEIASNLAFLSATSDDGLKVMAVCVEEHCNGKGITIRVASNSGDCSAVTNGFDKLAKVLEKAAGRTIAFRKVVDLDLYRILTRLRSRHAKISWKTAGKRALVEQLHNALHDSSIRTTAALTKSRREVQDLGSLFAHLESLTEVDAEMKEVVGAIVQQIYVFSSATNLKLALRTSALAPSLKAHLPEAIECHENLGRICTMLKTTIDRKILRASRSKKAKRYCYPNESVVLPLASWSSSGVSGSLLDRSSTSTIQPPPPLPSQEKGSVEEHSRCTPMPLTPPTTPPRLDRDSRTPSETKTSLTAPDPRADTGGPPSPGPLLTIDEIELPYCKSIDLTTPSVFLRLENLSLTLDFLQVFSGQLSITCGEEIAASRKGDRIINIQDIPTTSELQMTCTEASNELTFWLRNSRDVTSKRRMLCAQSKSRLVGKDGCGQVSKGFRYGMLGILGPVS
ncbi:Uncharacterized protein BP5553_06599 [Venustampulla echinocandica]|uniref:Uncharacterized protein n=1 Tax=Venustampulla echinocandica TaxID=2656787 RepID=A0A370TKF1_9HELO|nr:Uncharacterized protein BP5553_06599 [Venustampulla echinocandica]RDL35987.1 Uncharacterized protein BP5553_06599 [Venustampulla echinocandica]